MREIKFRAWDKTAQRILHEIRIKQHDPYSCWYQCIYCGLHVGSGGSDDYELMQYTGLKDKNGKEIYEGDILRCEWGHWYDKGTEQAYESKHVYTYEVIFYEGEFTVKVYKQMMGGTLHTYKEGKILGGTVKSWMDSEVRLGHEGYEVVGNIYESRELID